MTFQPFDLPDLFDCENYWTHTLKKFVAHGLKLFSNHYLFVTSKDIREKS